MFHHAAHFGQVYVDSKTGLGRKADSCCSIAPIVEKGNSSLEATPNRAPWRLAPARFRSQLICATYQSPNLAPIIQEIISRPGVPSGISLVVLLQGTGRRQFD